MKMNSPLMQIEELNDLIRQLHKIDAKIYAGQIVPAYRENRRVIALLEERKKELIASEEKINSDPERSKLSKVE